MTADADVHVIDDDEAVRESIDFLLRSAGLSVQTYESASSFLDARRRSRRAASSPTCGCRA